MRSDFVCQKSVMPLKDIALTFVPQLGVRGAAHLIDVFGSAEAVYQASESDLKYRAALREDIARDIASGRGLPEAEREMEYCRRHSIVPLGSGDSRYPRLLREIDDFPTVLYVRGNVEALQRRSVAFVGTRKISSYGQRVSDELVRSLVDVVPDVAVVSGLAYGVDGACHRAALAAGAVTIGVVANSLPSITPATHERLAEDMMAHGGAVVTELNSQCRQNGRYYIPRNRIIAAMTAGVVVVESPEVGGSLSTAAFADGYGRSVMAVPGRLTDLNSRGCNRLISNRRAQMVLSGSDIAQELMWELGVASPVPAPQRQPLTADEERLLALFDSDAVSIDWLQERSGVSIGELSLTLMTLELSGAVRQLPGKRYEKLI